MADDLNNLGTSPLRFYGIEIFVLLKQKTDTPVAGSKFFLWHHHVLKTVNFTRIRDLIFFIRSETDMTHCQLHKLPKNYEEALTELFFFFNFKNFESFTANQKYPKMIISSILLVAKQAKRNSLTLLRRRYCCTCNRIHRCHDDANAEEKKKQFHIARWSVKFQKMTEKPDAKNKFAWRLYSTKAIANNFFN